MDYYTTLITIGVGSIITLIVIIISNRKLETKIRKGFIITYLLVIIGASSEWGGTVLNGEDFAVMPHLAILLHFAVKSFEFIAAQILPIVCSKTIFETPEKPSKFNKIFYAFLQIYIVVEIALMCTNNIFVIDSNNVYHHADLYFMYTISCIISTIYLLSNISQFRRCYQAEKRIDIYFIVIFVIYGVTLQLVNPNMKTYWITIAIAATFIYVYYNGLIQWLDGHTNLLDKDSYNTYLQEHNKNKFALIILDANNFKQINDKLGHYTGDCILSTVAQMLKDTYNNYGKVYRIGGDEFAVIIERDIDKVEELNSTFVKNIQEKRQTEASFPYISYGYATYNPDLRDSRPISAIVKEADDNMYLYKNKVKEKQNQIK